MSAMASQINSLMIVYSAVYSGTDQRKHQSSASLAFVRGIHRWPVNSPHKGPVTRKIFYLMTSPWFARQQHCAGLHPLYVNVTVIGQLFILSPCLRSFVTNVDNVSMSWNHHGVFIWPPIFNYTHGHSEYVVPLWRTSIGSRDWPQAELFAPNIRQATGLDA